MPPREPITEQRTPEQDSALPQQQQVVSIRVSEELRLRLETLRQLIALKTGGAVTMSEAARQLLESARDNLLELANLLAAPTEYLRLARYKADTGELLTHAEWAMIAYYAWIGAEIQSDTSRAGISSESLMGILKAFLAVYDLRKAKKTREDAYYLSNLPAEEQRAIGNEHEAGRDEVRRAVNNTIHTLRKEIPGRPRPVQAVRNLYHLLDELEFPNLHKLNRELWQYWPILWRVAARGHYLRQGKPVPDPRIIDHRNPPPPLPGFEEGECTLSLARLPFDQLSFCLHLPGRLAPLVPISEYPAIAEFRAMLDEFDPDQESAVWRGHYFSCHPTRSETNEPAISFRSETSGIAFMLRHGDWTAIRGMARQAFERPEVRRFVEQQLREYGEF